jgi:uncharacterized protein YjbI with pentapeptide repeats
MYGRIAIRPYSALSTQHSALLVEFSHPKLGEYLCAQAIAHQLQNLTQQQTDNYGTLIFCLDSLSSVAQHLYNLLGYGVLTQKLEELIIETLLRQPHCNFSLKLLLQRLELFWRGYCQGRWLDEGIAHQAWNYFQTLHNPVNVEQINANVGINIFLLLSAGYRAVKLAFSPGGNLQNVAEFFPQALTMLMGRLAIASNHISFKRISTQSLAGINLSGASLQQVMLAKANFEQTNLSGAILIGANLAGANLSNANLTGANLSNANLTDANLDETNLNGANLTGANLSQVNLQTANLTNACLFDAILADADRETATLNGAVFSLEQYYTLKQLLSQSSLTSITNSTEKTEAWFKNNLDIAGIESLEGEPISSVNLYDDDVKDETVFNYGQ